MKYFVNQISSNDCGHACVKMILAKFHQCRDYLFDENIYENMSFLEMKRYLAKHHIVAEGYRVDEKHINKEINNSIVQIRENNRKHFIFLKKVKKSDVVILDPSIGKRIIDKNEFFKIFTGNCLKVIEYKRKKTKITNLVDIKIYKISFCISLLIDIGILYFLSYMTYDTYNLFNIILLIIVFLMNFCFKLLIIMSVNYHLDKKLINPFVNRCASIEDIQLLIEYRGIMITNSFKRIAFFTTSLLLIIILLYNSSFFIIPIIFSVFFILFKHFLLDDIETRIIEKSSNLEKNYQNNTQESYKKIKICMNKMIFYKIGYYVLFVFFSFLFYLFYNEIQRINSLSFILFNTFLTITLFDFMNKYYVLMTTEKFKILKLDNLIRNKLKKIKCN